MSGLAKEANLTRGMFNNLALVNLNATYMATVPAAAGHLWASGWNLADNLGEAYGVAEFNPLQAGVSSLKILPYVGTALELVEAGFACF